MPTIALVLGIALSTGGGAVVSESRPTLGTLATVTIAGVDPDGARPGIEAAFAVFARVDWSMNEWRAGTPLHDLNARAGQGWVALPPDLCEVLRLAKRGAARTGGLFDPTWAALSSAWTLEPGAPPPDRERVGAACALVGHRGLELRGRARAGCEARLARAGMRVGLGGIAKGWALDAAARALRALGYADFLLQAGGDLYAAGRRGEEPWTVGVRDPRGGRLDVLATVPVSDRAFSTSGDYEQGYEAGGRRYHHLLDPRTCEPATASRAVSVLAASAVDAEILGKALFLAGGARALALASRFGADAVVITAAGEVLATPALGRALRR
ncbi:MAG TPA: FAD:protein FMN transferase [Anaeromyxobacter sp.]|nr:FAD:protein FMN transferase [Anaeromyxobacter sp.]